MVVFEIEINPGLYQKLDPKKVTKAAEKAMTGTFIDLERAVKDECPYDTGRLHDSHSYAVKKSSSSVKGELSTQGAHYWRYVNFGTSRQKPNPYIRRGFEREPPGENFRKYFKQAYKPDGG